jgi:hypothetical protein
LENYFEGILKETMTKCYICEIDYKDEEKIVGTFSEHAPSNRNKNRFLDRDVCMNCISTVRDKNLKSDDLVDNNDLEFIKCSYCLIRYKPEMIKASLYENSREKLCCQKCLEIV